MKKLLLLAIALSAIFSQSFSQVVWSEDFQSIDDGVSNNSPKWVTTPPSGGTFRKETSLFYSGIFWIENTNTEGEWRTQNIDISEYGLALIDIAFISFNARSSDYIRVFYRVNGGPETQMLEFVGSGYEQAAGGSAIVTGNSLQIIIRARETSPSQFFGLIPTYLAFDNLTVTGIETLYSIRNGDWTNETLANGPWSEESGGTPCGCSPNLNTRAIINSGHSVNINDNIDATIVEIASNGTLQWSSDNRSLNLYRGGYITNNGTLTKNGRTNAEVVFPQAYSYSITNTSNLNVDEIQLGNSTALNFTNNAGGVLTLGAFNGNNGDFTVDNFGVINQTGNFSNVDAGSSFNNRTGGTWNWNYAGGTGTAPPSGLNCSAVGNTFVYAAAGNQGVRGTTYHNVTFSGSGEKRTNGNLDINGDLLISGSARLNPDTNDDDITLAGNWTVTSSNADPFVEGSELVTFDGTGNQVFTQSVGSNLNRLVVNKPGGRFILGSNLTINNGSGTDLTLTSGIIQTSASALLIISDGATTNAGDADSFVDGPIRKIGNQEYTFPTGSGSRWAPIRISNFSGGTGTAQFTAQYFPTKYSNTTTDATLAHVSWAEYWTLDRNASTRNVSVTLHWQSALSDITNLNDLRVARFNGTTWVSEGNAARSGNATTGTVRSNTITNFSPFTFGSFGGINPLPVELTQFAATLNNHVVDLKWSTASELNNDYFTVERATNLEQFEEVKQVKGNGTTNETQHYSITDQNPLYGRSYYRLKQTDYDGTVSYSNLQVIDYEGPMFAALHTYPNPGTGKTLTIEVKGLVNVKQLPLQIFNAQGVVVYQSLLSVNDSGSIHDELSFTNTLPPGIYIVKAGKTHLLTSKIVIQ